MSAFASVKETVLLAWRDRYFLFSALIVFKFLTFAFLAPAIGILLNFSVSLSTQSALTDQDIARFLFTPLGFVATIIVASSMIVSTVLFFACITIAIARRQTNHWQAITSSSTELASRLKDLFSYAAFLVMRVLIIVLPFVFIGLFAANALLSKYDINYYLTNHPPNFYLMVCAGVVLLTLMGAILVVRLLSWSLSLHLVLFGKSTSWKSFHDSSQIMLGHRLQLAKSITFLYVITGVAAAGFAAFVGLAFKQMPMAGESLKLVLVVAVLAILLWLIVQTLLEAISTGSVARMMLRIFENHFESWSGQLNTGTGKSSSILKWILAGSLVAGSVGLISSKFIFDRVRTTDNVQIIAHRGAAGVRPENTMASVKKAIADGADWVEIDVQETADGEIVVVHDSDFMKLSQTDLKVWDATMTDLAKIDIGTWFSPDYAAERTPTLREVLNEAKGKSNVLIELKYYGHDIDLEKRVIAIVEETETQDMIATMSLKYPAVEKMKSMRPNWNSGVLAATSIGNLAKLNADFFAISAQSVSSSLIGSVHAENKIIYVWTVNDPLEMSSLISKGVDGIITDEPALLRKVIETRKTLNAPERFLLSLAHTIGVRLNLDQYRDDSP